MMSLAAKAQELLRQGRLPEAESGFARLLEESPDYVEGLNILALSALRGGQVQRAIDFLGRATKADPQDAVTQHHLGRAFEGAGDFAAALRAHETAVRLRPDFAVARLYWAAALERAQQVEAAVVQYVRALDDAQKGGRWLNPESTPPVLRPLVEHAVITARDHRSLAFSRLFEPLVKRFGKDSLARVANTLSMYFSQYNP